MKQVNYHVSIPCEVYRGDSTNFHRFLQWCLLLSMSFHRPGKRRSTVFYCLSPASNQAHLVALIPRQSTDAVKKKVPVISVPVTFAEPSSLEFGKDKIFLIPLVSDC